jgi:hypothetical protein
VNTVSTTWTATAKKGGEGAFEKAPPGNHPAVLVAIIDMGTQWQEGYQGAPGKWQRRAYFVWELVLEKRAEGGGNHVIALDLNVSLNDKAKLRKWIEARTGKAIPDGVEYDVSQELGQPCLLGVVMKGDFPKVDSVSGVPKGMAVAEPGHKPVLISLDEFRAGAKIPDWVPYLYGEPLADVIKRCKEIGGLQGKGEGESTGRRAAVGGDPTTPVRTAQPADAPPPPDDDDAPGDPGPPRWWVHAEGKTVLMTAGEIEAWAGSRKVDPDTLKVMPEDKSGGWKVAKEYGIKWQIPF